MRIAVRIAGKPPRPACGVGNDATAFYFRNATLAAAFVARWCEGGSDLPVRNGAFLMRTDAPRRRSEMPHYGWKMPGSSPDE